VILFTRSISCAITMAHTYHISKIWKKKKMKGVEEKEKAEDRPWMQSSRVGEGRGSPRPRRSAMMRCSSPPSYCRN